MKDVRIRFNGENDTVFDWSFPVEGKAMYAQKCLINLATEKGSDPLYSNRGTDLHRSAIGGSLLSNNAIAHAGNFAALNTVMFVNGEDYAAVSGSPDLVHGCAMQPVLLDKNSSTLTYKVTFRFADGAETNSDFTV